jgi:predicted DNA-binding protein YlxM (UPF0122 family)
MAKKYSVTRVTVYIALHTNATKLAPYEQLLHLVLKFIPSIVVNGTSGFSVRNVSRTI